MIEKNKEIIYSLKEERASHVYVDLLDYPTNPPTMEKLLERFIIEFEYFENIK